MRNITLPFWAEAALELVWYVFLTFFFVCVATLWAGLYILDYSVTFNVGSTVILFVLGGITLILKSVKKEWHVTLREQYAILKKEWHVRLRKQYVILKERCKKLEIVFVVKPLLTILIIALVYFIVPFVELYEHPKLFDPKQEFHNQETQQHDNSQASGNEFVKLRSDVIRNHGWILWGITFSIFSLIGICIAVEGRKIQKKQWETQHISHLRERFEKSASMLGEPGTASRVGGCHALKDLAVQNRDMKIECLTVLFSFIEEPYLHERYKHKSLERVFPINEKLRSDIQEAADGITAIYEHYKKEYDDDDFEFKFGKRITLPHYFLKNKTRREITIIEGNFSKLILKDLHNVNLKRGNFNRSTLTGYGITDANLIGSDFTNAKINAENIKKVILRNAIFRNAEFNNCTFYDVDMKKANMKSATFNEGEIKKLVRFNGADISSANMETIDGLTRKHVLSAEWGTDNLDEPPKLPDDLSKDEEVQEWLDE